MEKPVSRCVLLFVTVVFSMMWGHLSCQPSGSIKATGNMYDGRGATDALTAFTCEWNTLRLSCAAGERLEIDYANYGRMTSSHHCGCNIFICNTNCGSTSSLSIVRQKCDGKQQCTVAARNDVFGGDPCSGTEKYLEVTYRCEDVNECVDNGGRGPCEQICTNTDGSYACSCRDGYILKDDGYACDECLRDVSNCEDYICTSPTTSECVQCLHNRGPGREAYELSHDGRTCRELCSWRNTCYPGDCGANNYRSECTCATQFTGDNCLTITEKPTMYTCLGKVKRVENGKRRDKVEADCMATTAQSTVWTNLRLTASTMYFEAEWETSFQPSQMPPSEDYIAGYSVGVTAASTDWRIVRGDRSISDGTLTCKSSSFGSPNTAMQDCSENVTIPEEPQHGDRVHFTAKASNGGYVRIRNYDYSPFITNTRYYTGQEVSHSAHFTFDFHNPYHCSTEGLCADVMLDRGQAITRNGDITLRWSGWKDDDSGIGEYEYEVYKLRPFGDMLGMKGLSPVDGQNGTVGAETTETNIHLTEPGVYSIVLTVEDACGPGDGNFAIARRFLIYDDNSTVEADASGHHPMWAESASNITGRVWQTNLQDDMGNGPQVICRQPPATRSREAIPNANTITMFQTDWGVDHLGGRSLGSPPGNWENVTNLMSQRQSRDIPRQDGNTIRFWVRAFDVMGNYADDSVTIHVDSSPPVIEDIFLSRGGIDTLAVHHTQELYKMTVVFSAHDDHSGLHNIHWELHDMADPTVVHGEGQVAVRRPSTLHPECPPPFCTCIPKDEECYFRNYEFSPDENKMSISSGSHDHDYYIVITVTNNAMLQAQGRFQPAAETDLDFQQGSVIQASWEGFFDRESGVIFYMYGFAEVCLTLENMTEFENNIQVANTTSTHAQWEATDSGLYHCTVIAFNRALEPSEPVCSDGVTIDVTPPIIADLVVDNLHYTPGVIKGKDDDVWLVDSSGFRQAIVEPSRKCRNISQEIDDINLWPAINLLPNRTAHPVYKDSDCLTVGPFSGNAFLSRENMLSLRWNGKDPESGVYDYEVGLSSTLSPDLPDIMPFTPTNAHSHFTTYHPNLEEEKQFYLVLKAINRARMSTTKILGPFVVDVTPPAFSTFIKVTMEEKNGSQSLVARWDSRPTSVYDTSDQGRRYKFEYSVGHCPGTTEVLDFAPLSDGDRFCNITTPPTCVAIPVSALDWHLHGQHTYYVSIRVENSAGLSTLATSQPYVHVVGGPSSGVVLELDPEAGEASIFGRPADIDIQSKTDTISCAWLGFSHPHQEVNYQVGIGTQPGLADITSFTYVGQNTSFTAHNLHLATFQTYYVTVVAATESGTISVTSDGVLVLQDDDVINGTKVFDGLGCNMDKNRTFSHHANLSHVECSENNNFQISTTTVEARWIIPDAMKKFVRRVEWAVEKEVTLNGVSSWVRITEFRNMQMSSQGTWTGLSLLNSNRYRSVVMFCHPSGCFQPVHSDRFTVLHNPPTPGQITSIGYNRTSKVLAITWQQFGHDDTSLSNIEDPLIHYEWNLATEVSSTGSAYGDIILQWQTIKTTKLIKGKLTHEVTLDDELDFTHCLRLLIRGYNRAGLYSTAARDVLDCDAYDPTLIAPTTVIDAVGNLESPHMSDVHLAQNQKWPTSDQEFTPARDKLSAVWPTLRHRRYKWKVVSDDAIQHWAYVVPRNALRYSDYDCSAPQVLACGETEENFVNVPDIELLHGRRYHLCVHANATVLHFELFDQPLDEVDACSNGITVDLTPPLQGQVWVNHREMQFQTSTSEMVVYWDAFRDVEEGGMSSHHSGIRKYEVAIGTSPTGVDVKDYMDVGVTNMATVHGLRLYSGHTYYATVRATDYVGLTVASVSQGVTVDVTAPLVTDADINVGGRYLLSSSSVSANWNRVFKDPESGMLCFEWCVGSQPGHCDMMALTKTESEEAMSDCTLDLHLQEGHAYYISVTGYNGSGLSSTASSWAAVVDTSPPVAGFVYDGVSGGNSHDVDFQTDIETLHTWWTGFHDPHTALAGYSWSIGTCRGCDDVMEAEDVGLIQEASVEHLGLVSGKRYYVTVLACNAADLCTSATSDGIIIDNSPPSAGTVYDGVDDMDLSFQASRTFLGAHWFGFHDPHSGLSHYEWRAGTTPGGDDVYSTSRLHLTEMAYVSRVDPPLPIGQAVYVTIRAYNKAGLFVERSSNGVKVDDTPPVFVSSPSFDLHHGSIIAESQVWRTILSITWEVSDPDSPIERQHLSVFTHHQTDLDIEPVQIVGSVRAYKFTNLSLHDGNTYFVRVVACNRAQLCTSAETDGLLVDSTPPTVGMFAVHTEHAAQLSRHQDGWMGYQQQNDTTPPHVRLAWLGFSDIHTGIENYHVTIGSELSGRDLSGGQVIVSHKNGITHEDEGVIQTASVNISRDLTPGERIYISLWAVNKVGLESLVAQDAFEVVPSSPHSGILSLVRRCDAESCEGDCTCAPQNQKCGPPEMGCNDITDPSAYQQVLVYDVTDMRSLEAVDADVTPSQCTLAARWEILPGEKQIERFEWSAGGFGEDPETSMLTGGIWFDVGLRTRAVLSLPRDGYLLQPEIKYVFHVRAWYGTHEYLDFHSNGILTDFTPPAVSKSRKVNDMSDVGHVADVDFINSTSQLAVGWRNVFMDHDVGVAYFLVSLSTFPGGEDIIPFSHFNMSSTTDNILLQGLTLEPNVEYYSNVMAFNRAGMHTTVSSDGVLVDTESPTVGVVQDGLGVQDADYQNTSCRVAATWHGFSDLQSFIHHYICCFGTAPGRDDVSPCEEVGLRLSTARDIPCTLQSGTKYYATVYAVDASGLWSPPAVSDGVTVDTTAPVPLEKVNFGMNLLSNPSFEDVQNTGTVALPSSWLTSGIANVHSPSQAIGQDGRSYLLLLGSVSQAVATIPGDKYRLTFQASTIFPSNTPVLSQEGYVQGPGIHRVFKLYQRPSHLEGTQLHLDTNITWHQHLFYFTAVQAVSNITIGSAGVWNGVALDNVQVQRIQFGQQGPSADPNFTAHQTSPVYLYTRFVHDWTSVHAAWDFVDAESPIVNYSWAIGTVRGGTQLQTFRSVGRNTHAKNNNIRLDHGILIHVTVVAENAADLRSVVYSDPVLVDLTPPVISDLKDGSRLEDLDYQNTSVISLYWDVRDDESGVDFCEWTIGLSPGSGELQSFIRLSSTLHAVADLSGNVTHGQTIYPTVRCTNHAGMSSHATSDGVTVVLQPPKKYVICIYIAHINAPLRNTPVSQVRGAAAAGLNLSLYLHFYRCRK
ncbi:ADGRL2 [Branchiostoma lanceolatum]|uniref:ADGRL2 protein n=1 Tax=Branchiostoma lanceolatum TaxID=7740 RepID=A0A8J9ZPF2_BRALA|nr:ADGRL2 [Branchiostoma lanceolatum]